MTELRPHQRVWHRLWQAIGILIVAAFVAGPPAYVIYLVLSGDPLWASRTVTETVTHQEYYGVIPEAGAILGPWAVLLIIGWGMSTGAFPRGIR